MADDRVQVRLESFEGPLDLLSHLVKTNELDLYNLPIAVITDQYLQYLDMFEQLNLDVAGEYLVMAATLHVPEVAPAAAARRGRRRGSRTIPPAISCGQLAGVPALSREAAEQLRDRALLGRDVFRRAPSPPERDGTEGDVRSSQSSSCRPRSRRCVACSRRLGRAQAARARRRRVQRRRGRAHDGSHGSRSVERLPFTAIVRRQATRGIRSSRRSSAVSS
jgi:hypothetical protein